jgi:hypothetical protein
MPLIPLYVYRTNFVSVRKLKRCVKFSNSAAFLSGHVSASALEHYVSYLVNVNLFMFVKSYS